MAKVKAKKTGYGRDVQVESDGWCHWTAEGHQWRWGPGLGLNLQLWHDEGWQPLVFAKTLAEAGSFAEGFASGWLAYQRVGANTQGE